MSARFSRANSTYRPLGSVFSHARKDFASFRAHPTRYRTTARIGAGMSRNSNASYAASASFSRPSTRSHSARRNARSSAEIDFSPLSEAYSRAASAWSPFANILSAICRRSAGASASATAKRPHPIWKNVIITTSVLVAAHYTMSGGEKQSNRFRFTRNRSRTPKPDRAQRPPW